MSNETRELAAFATGLRYEDIPPAVVRRAKDCLIDTVAVCLYGHQAPWVPQLIAYLASAPVGSAEVIGASMSGLNAESAAFANGVLAHSLELDSLRQPGAGVHPGATLGCAALACAQETGASGRDVIVAFVAGCEVLFRVGRATKHSAEGRGFHAPGLTGPFGSATVAARLLGLDADALARAYGIAGSLCGGLMEFAHSGEGGFVKRLHLGRSAESGVTAARLAKAGLGGPTTILEGAKGMLACYCAEYDVSLLTEGLGKEWETERICFKRYPCHITAHTVVRAIEVLKAELLKAEHGFKAEDVASVTIDGSARMRDVNGKRQPADLTMATYSIPFCAAVALERDPLDPDNFGAGALDDASQRALRERIEVISTRDGGHASWETTTRITLRDGRTLERHQADFPGTPGVPLERADLRAKFDALTRRVDRGAAQRLFERLDRLETQPAVGWLLP